MTENQEVPELSIENNKVVTPKREVPLMVNGEEKSVTLRKLTTGERNEIRQKCVKTKMRGGQSDTDINSELFQELLLVKAIENAPFDTSQEGIRSLPDNVADYLFTEYNEFAEPTKKKQEQ